MHPDTQAQTPALTLGRSLWAIRPEALPGIVAVLRGRHGSLERLAARGTAAAPHAARQRASTTRAGGAVAVIPLTGVITPRGFFSFFFGGGGGLMDFRQSFRAALNDPDVGSIVLDVDSPGGLVDLVPETAQEVFDARGEKPIIAVANTMAASAAYFIASQADELVVTPSGDVGSIGTYMLHEDWSAFNERTGIVPTYVVSADSPYKVDGNMDEPLSDTALAEWQQEVDDLTGMFIDAVARGRGVPAETIRDEYGKGRCLLSDRALTAGMVDRVATIEEVVGEQLLPAGSASGAMSAARAGRRALIEAVTPPDPSQDPCEDLEPDNPEDIPADNGPGDPPEPPSIEPDPDPDPDDDGDSDPVMTPAALSAFADHLIRSP